MNDVFERGHALLIGVGADLPNTVQDAEGLACLLQDPVRCAYIPDRVRVLTAQNATRGGIIDGLEALAKAAGEDDTVIVYYSGHGYRIKTALGNQYFLMPYGYDVNDLSGTALAADVFLQALRQVRARKLLLLLDCCYAGGLDDVKAPGMEISKAALPPDAQVRLAEGKGRLVIASSRDEEVSYAGKPYSMFTLALLEALCGAGASQKDGYVRVADVATYAYNIVLKRTGDKQHPVLNFDGADNFELAYYAAGDAQPKGLPFDQPAEVEIQPGQFAPVDPPVQVSYVSDNSDHSLSEINVTNDRHIEVNNQVYNVDARGNRGVVQTGWKVGGNVNQPGRDSYQAGRDINIRKPDKDN